MAGHQDETINNLQLSRVSFYRGITFRTPELKFPTFKDISEDVRQLEAYYFAVGEVSDVYKALMVKSDRTVSGFIEHCVFANPDLFV
jgi:hypothetical protein